MGDPAPFDRLVSELSHDDRQQLLDRVRRAAPLTDAPLADPNAADAPHFDLAEEYEKLGWLQRVILGFRALLTGLARDAALLALLNHRIGTSIQRSHPGLVDIRHELLSPTAGEALQELSRALLPLRDACHDALSLRRDQFVAYLLATLQPRLHERLLHETDPERVAAGTTGFDGADSHAALASVRREMESRFDDAIASIPEAQRRSVYLSVVALHRLNELIQYDVAGLARRCSGAGARFTDIRAHFLSFANKLLTATRPPPEVAMQALLLFHYDASSNGASGDTKTGQSADTGDDDIADDPAAARPSAVAQRLEADLHATNVACDAVRAFGARLPVVATCRLVSGDVNWQPDEAVGGEDWYALARGYWRRRLTARFDVFARRRGLEQIRVDACAALGVAELPTVDAYERVSEPAVGRHATTVGVLAALTNPLATGLRPLRILLTNGEFYRNDNRISFERSLADLQAAPRELASLGAALDDDGNQIADPREHADELARRLVGVGTGACTELTALLGGILEGKVGGQYDSITNRTTIGGRENRQLLDALAATRSMLETVASHLRRGLDLELKWIS